MSSGNLMIVQGGGPTPVFNASLASSIAEAREQPRIGQVYGARWGMQGLAAGDVLNLGYLRSSDLHSLRDSPGAALGSSRFKPTEEDLHRCVEHLRHLRIHYLLFMGGNGTMRGADIVREFCRRSGFDIQIIGVPKTIDNDIAGTDRCPGFAIAARFVAQTTLDLSMDASSLLQPVSIFETLGRDVGWLAAASTLARQDADEAPHLVYVPEIPFSRENFLDDLDTVVSRLGWAIVVVSEGICDADRKPIFEQRFDSPRNARNRPLIGGVAQHLAGLVAENLGIRCRNEKPGLVGRSSMAFVAQQDVLDAELVGREGVRALVAGETDKMVALRAHEDPTGFELTPLHASGVSRAIPAAWLSHDSQAVTEGYRKYLRPLVGELTRYPAPLHAGLVNR